MLTPQHGRGAPHSRRRWHSQRRLALLGSLCFFLSAIEYLIPKPLPFMRIGLANMPLLLALDIFGPGEFFLLALLKILGQGLVGGMIFSHVFLFSTAGTFASCLVMFALRRLFGKKLLGYAGLGCAGAMASNCAQLVLARYFIFGPALRYLAAPFLASGLVTGVALGLICEYFCRRSVWYLSSNTSRRPCPRERASEAQREEKMNLAAASSAPPRLCVMSSWKNFNAGLHFAAGLLTALIFLFNRSMEIRIAQFLLFCLFAFFFGRKINLLATVLFMGGIVFFHLLAPSGKVLASLGFLRITQGGLYAGIDKALVVCGLVILSRVCVRSDLRLPGTVGSVLGESLSMLELMREKRGMIKYPHILSGLDQLLLEMEKTDPDTHVNTHADTHRDTHTDTPVEKNAKSVLLLCAMVLITLGMNFIPHS